MIHFRHSVLSTAAIAGLLVSQSHGTLIFTPVSTAGATATQTTTLSTYNASNVIDGNFGNFSHTLNSDTNPTLTLTLPSAASFNAIRVYNRGDGCCGYRLQDITVKVFTNPGDASPVFTSGLLNPANVLGGPAVLNISPGSLLAQQITVNRTPTTGLANPDDNSVLSIGEIVLGNLVDQFLPLNTNINHAPIVNFSVSQSTTNGDS